ncbi:hypothetical protein [Marinitoga lauensis]|uniref:hypothetical protein n=1 Tax=Marinitoga lauensis TaxID=2201189 RepID=UPI0010116683|nr:hypothetical protein [Marinitoga lauensis]
MNNYRLKNIIFIVQHGSFSKAIINYLLDIIDDESLRYYLLLLKSIWDSKYRNAFKYANKVISTTTTILRELARFEKIWILSLKKRQNNMIEEINILKNNLSSLPDYARNLIIPGLKLLGIRLDIDENLRIYSQKYEGYKNQQSIIKYSEARKK